MIKLRTILLSKYLYIFFFVLSLFFVFFKVKIIKVNTNIKKEETHLVGRIRKITEKEDTTTIKIKVKKEYVIGYIKKKVNYSLNDKIELEGTLERPKNNTLPNQFNYRKYLYRNKTFYIMKIEQVKILQKNKNLFFKIKESIINKLNEYKSSSYLKLFLLGEKTEVERKVYKSFQNNGISHLFSVSGLHVSVLSTTILSLLKFMNVKEKKRYSFVLVFLLFYLFLTNGSPPILRSVLLFFFLSINKIYYLEIKPIYLFLLTLSICLFLNPYYIYNIGFLFSFTITFYLILFSTKLQVKSKIKSLLLTSFLSFLVSIPICLYNFFFINPISILYNLFYVPFISNLVFPLSLLVFFFPFLEPIFLFFINILEKTSKYLNTITFFRFSFSKPSLILCIFYYMVITILLYFFFYRKKNYFYVLLFLLSFHYCSSFLIPKNYILVLDVGQGDSVLFHSEKKNILIDTGGKINKEQNQVLQEQIVSTLFSLGIKKLDQIIITHGDFDHMGEAINLVNKFKVEKVIFNCGPYNGLEKDLIKVLDKKNIKYYSCIKELNIDKNKLYFLQTKYYDNENDNSNVIYMELSGYKFMFMGDAGVEKEEDILDKYNISDIDVLKVGHHGSKTSSGKEFIDEINPKYSIISVGKNNRYGHPNKEVLENLKDSKIYRTDQDGSIMFKIKNNKLKIETCSP